ncbi:potassium transporter TrkA [Micromonospora sp. NPDC000316]|uniref:potassium transporter TrkA n=1 Tax=Micromonospora sp. NPDC000316 TaxID=3364216 RepID=UPI0036C5A819
MAPLRPASANSVVVVGTGAFASGVCRSLARTLRHPAVVHVIGRSTGATEDICLAASVHATMAERPVRFQAVTSSLGPGDDLRPTLRRLAPRLVLVCASAQSPAEARTTRTAWSALLREAGFGVTLPLQTSVVQRVAADYADVSDKPLLINACFPDAVNPLLRAWQLPVFCGLGNVGALALAVQEQLGLADPTRLKLFAHHTHLHRPAEPDAEAVAWLDDRPLDGVSELLEPVRRLPRPLVNEVSAWTAGPLVQAILDDECHVGHLPGPCGLPGGYPVAVTGSSLALRLPPGTSPASTAAWNERVSALDGVTVSATGSFSFTDEAIKHLRRWWPDAPQNVPPDRLAEFRADLGRLRDELRQLEPDRPHILSEQEQP